MCSNKTQNIVILGSTGSIGTSTLKVIRQNQDQFNVVGLSCSTQVSVLADQIREFSPEVVTVGEGKADELVDLLGNGYKELTILEGDPGYVELAIMPQSDFLVAACVGAAGLKPVMSAIEKRKTIALANKETMVLAGTLMMEAARRNGVKILPIDSEHNAIFQGLSGNSTSDIRHITLTASGGPFRLTPFSEFGQITLEQALHHPNWSMGKKITVDSATMMNKCLEVIEAIRLFELKPDQVKVLIHPQSIIHSMVTYKDGSTIAQMGQPDMCVPISYCLGYPERLISGCSPIDLAEIAELSFFKVDAKKFPTVQLAYDVVQLGGGAPAVLNGANEKLVELFLNRQISFMDILQTLPRLVERLKMIFSDLHHPAAYLKNVKTVEDCIKADAWGRMYVDDMMPLS